MNPTDEFTLRLLADAGINHGQRVLDIGCGTGAVTKMAAGRVGPTGEVIGIDRSAAGLKLAQADCVEAGYLNTRFVEMDLNEVSDEMGRFDAIVGRRVLMYQRDAAATLKHLAKALKPGGLIVLHEHNASATPIHRGALPLHSHVHWLIWETVRREGADLEIGFSLAPALEAAGLTVDQMRVQATVLTSSVESHPIEAIVRAMVPRMIEQGVVSAGELEVEGLDQRLAEERRASNTICLWDLVFGAWARFG